MCHTPVHLEDSIVSNGRFNSCFWLGLSEQPRENPPDVGLNLWKGPVGPLKLVGWIFHYSWESQILRPLVATKISENLHEDSQGIYILDFFEGKMLRDSLEKVTILKTKGHFGYPAVNM